MFHPVSPDNTMHETMKVLNKNLLTITTIFQYNIYENINTDDIFKTVEINEKNHI